MKQPKRIIDADKLIDWLCDGGQRFYAEFIEKVNQMAKPAPKSNGVCLDDIDDLFEDIFKKGTYNIMGIEYDVDRAILRSILWKIKGLATPKNNGDL